jgi:hypothetical protein
MISDNKLPSYDLTNASKNDSQVQCVPNSFALLLAQDYWKKFSEGSEGTPMMGALEFTPLPRSWRIEEFNKGSTQCMWSRNLQGSILLLCDKPITIIIILVT